MDGAKCELIANPTLVDEVPSVLCCELLNVGYLYWHTSHHLTTNSRAMLLRNLLRVLLVNLNFQYYRHSFLIMVSLGGG